nr:cytospin-B-like isoform X1 [Paramormyrops kingsleyae]
MMKGGATKGGLPKPTIQEKGRLPSASSVMAMKSSRSSGTLAADLRLSRQLKRASSDDALAKPRLGAGAVAVACRMKKTVTTGAICELADARPRSLTVTTYSSTFIGGFPGSRNGHADRGFPLLVVGEADRKRRD